MSTYNVCFCGEIRKIFTNTLLSRVMVDPANSKYAVCDRD